MAPPAKKCKIELVPEISAKYKCVNPSENFLDESTLNYILETSSQKAYYKLIQVSKYFLVKEPPQIKTFERIYYNGDYYPLVPDQYNISEVNGNRLWIISPEFGWRCSSVLVNGFLRRCFRMNVRILDLKNQRISYDELKFLMETNTITYLELINCEITHSNGVEVAIEDILKMAPLLKYLTYCPPEPFTFSPEKVASLPDFYHLESIDFKGIDEDFCCRAFRNFLKKASTVTSGRFRFNGVLSRYLREFQMTVLKEVDPTIEVKCFDGAVFFGEYEQAED